jgi:hypothetical protein
LDNEASFFYKKILTCTDLLNRILTKIEILNFYIPRKITSALLIEIIIKE